MDPGPPAVPDEPAAAGSWPAWPAFDDLLSLIQIEAQSAWEWTRINYPPLVRGRQTIKQLLTLSMER
jgi:hypothetical protein